MLIADFMTRHPILVPPTMSASEAQRIFSENHIRHLPVVSDGKQLVGLVTRQQLLLKADAVGSLNIWDISRFLADLKVSQVMIIARDVLTVAPGSTLERASQIMLQSKIGCLPVVDEENAVIGIVTETDLLRAFQEMLSLNGSGARVTVRIADQRGEAAKLFAVVAERGWSVVAAGTYPARRRPGFLDVVLKLPEVSLDEARGAFSASDEQQVVDVRAGR